MTGSSCPEDMDDFSPDLSFSSVVATLLREAIVGKKMPGWATVKQMAAMAVILESTISYCDIVVTCIKMYSHSIEHHEFSFSAHELTAPATGHLRETVR
jgi:hypothetical protein